MFCSAAKVELSFAEAWQLVQYCPKPIRKLGLEGGAGQSTSQVDPSKPYQPQNQPSCEPLLSRTITAELWLSGRRYSHGTSWQAAAGGGYISLIMMAPSGTGACATDFLSGRCVFSHSNMSFEYQTRTGACVPAYLPTHFPFR